MSKSFVLVTGANGFIGKFLCQELAKANFKVRAVIRRDNLNITGVHESIRINDIASDIDWDKLLYDVGTVVHLISRVHMTKDNSPGLLSEFRRINVTGTEKLAKMAVKYGVRRLIYISSIKVNGEYNHINSNDKILCFTEESKPEPQDHYGISKWEAEQVLHTIQKETKLEIVILRLPLVYGPEAKANFLSLIKLVKLGLPLPFASIKNSRSVIYLGNLTDAILKCITHPNAANQTFLISDGKDISTPDLMRAIAKAFNQKPLLIKFSPKLLRILGKISGKSQEIEKLVSSLCIDIGKIKKILEWEPPYTLEQGIKLTVDAYRSE